MIKSSKGSQPSVSSPEEQESLKKTEPNRTREREEEGSELGGEEGRNAGR